MNEILLTWTYVIDKKSGHVSKGNNQIKLTTPDRRQSKTLILSMDVDQKSLETEFSIAICRQSPDCRQIAIENTVSRDFDPR